MKMKLFAEKKEKKTIFNTNHSSLKHLSLSHLLKLRVHIGHKNNILNKKMNSLILGTFQNINIIDPIKCLYYWERVYLLFSQLFLYRSTFFLSSTNKNLPNHAMGMLFELEFLNKISNLPNFSGFVTESWQGGILSNWTSLWSFIKLLMQKRVKGKSIRKKHYLLLKYSAGRILKGSRPLYPDIIFSLNSDESLLREAFLIKICTLSLVDSNKDISQSSLIVPGNDDSLNVIKFFMQLLEESYFEGSLEEKELFYKTILDSIKKVLYNNSL